MLLEIENITPELLAKYIGNEFTNQYIRQNKEDLDLIKLQKFKVKIQILNGITGAYSFYINKE